jgi:RNA polymerase sigma-70 factor (ECF subfamily)
MTAIDDARLTQLFNRHYSEVLAYCARRIGRDDADDAASEVYAVAWRRRDEIEWETSRAWLYGIARRVVSNRRRSVWRRHRLNERVSTLASTYADAADVYVIQREQDRTVLEALGRLGQQDQEILRLHAWEDLTSSEVAVVLHISVAAAEKRLQRAIRRLERSLGSPSPRRTVDEVSRRAAEEGGG